MKTGALLDAFAARLAAADVLLARIDRAPWIDTLEAVLPHRLPHSFGVLVRRWTYAPFDWGPISFYGNAGNDDRDDFARAITIDRAIWDVTRAAGFVPFARPATGSYDPICFAPRQRRKSRECPIVRLDHEAILTRDRIDIVEEIAPSFIALAERLLASGQNPEKRDVDP